MAFRLEFSVEAERDFGLIFDHFLQSYPEFDESLESAFNHAEARMLETRAAAERILIAPHRGERQTRQTHLPVAGPPVTRTVPIPRRDAEGALVCRHPLPSESAL